MIQFNNDGEGFQLQAISSSKLLFLSGEPINEKVTTYDPYVMNTQTEILEAMRDYQMGKMGFYLEINDIIKTFYYLSIKVITLQKYYACIILN